MKSKRTLFLSLIFIILVGISSSCHQNQNQQKTNSYAIVIHGGAGNIRPELLPDSLQNVYKHHLSAALAIGDSILKAGGRSIDAVEATINYMEDCPLFNAGKGAVFTHDGTHEMDASIMMGENLMAGAVAGVRDIKNPISAARLVLQKSKFVLLSGAGASEFARRYQLEIVDPSYFSTSRRKQSLQNALKAEKHGTVGCVALDKHGNICAGTSTGGMTNKRWGRIGDSPIIGAGTYANNNSCGISATGHGEFFIRYTVAHDISALMQYKNLSLKGAAQEVIQKKLKAVNGEGGIIGVDHNGNIVMEFNTNMMFRAYSKENGDKGIAIF